jgi:hypothetical protein
LQEEQDNNQNHGLVASYPPVEVVKAPHLDGGQDISQYFKLPSSRQPSRADIFEQLFVSHLIESFGRSRDVSHSPFWFLKLPALLALPKTPGLVKQSFRATVMMFYGNLTGDIPIQSEACKWYGTSLGSLRSLIQTNNVSEDGPSNLCIEVICALIMLFHFEMMASTSPDACMQHIDAAVIILGRLGPDNCRCGLAHQLFLNVRVLIVRESLNPHFENDDYLTKHDQAFASLTTARSKPHIFASRQWMTTPFGQFPKNPMDRLIDILLSSSIYSTADKEGSKSELYTAAHNLSLELDAWWLQYISKVDGEAAQNESWVSFNESTNLSHLGLTTLANVSNGRLSIASFALYHAANIRALSHLHFLSPSIAIYEHRIKLHAQEVILANEFVKTNGDDIVPGSGLMLSMLFPLKVVGLWSPSSQHKSYAVQQLRGWGQRKAGPDNMSTLSDVLWKQM